MHLLAQHRSRRVHHDVADAPTDRAEDAPA